MDTDFITIADIKELLDNSLVEIYLPSNPPFTTTTSLPTIPQTKHDYNDFKFTKLMEMMHAQMLEHEELRVKYPELYKALNNVGDIETTCILEFFSSVSMMILKEIIMKGRRQRHKRPSEKVRQNILKLNHNNKTNIGKGVAMNDIEHGDQNNDWKKALKDFMRQMVLVIRVEDFQLGVESYQFKLNLTKIRRFVPGIKAIEPYSIVEEPMFGNIYENDKFRFMAIDEIKKFSTDTLERSSSRNRQKLIDNKLNKN
ncbi:hypothetical protein Tco_0505913 [Tanacetum coccineum]